MPKDKFYISNYVKSKRWNDGNETLSFKLDAYTRGKFDALPDGTWIQIAKKRAHEDDNTHYMFTLQFPTGGAQPQQRSYSDDTIPF